MATTLDADDVDKKSTIIIPSQSLIIKNIDFLVKLHQAASNNNNNKKSNKRRVESLVKNATLSELETLAELSKNFLAGTFPGLTRELVRDLQPFRNSIRGLASKKLRPAVKKRILLRKVNQKGGFLPLLTLLAPIISSVLGTVISTLI